MSPGAQKSLNTGLSVQIVHWPQPHRRADFSGRPPPTMGLPLHRVLCFPSPLSPALFPGEIHPTAPVTQGRYSGLGPDDQQLGGLCQEAVSHSLGLPVTPAWSPGHWVEVMTHLPPCPIQSFQRIVKDSIYPALSHVSQHSFKAHLSS